MLAPPDAVTIEDIYRSHYGWLIRWFMRGLNCSETAADLSQDTFSRLIQRDLDGVSVREPRAYLTRIAQGLLRNHWRREDIERAYLEALAMAPQATAPSQEERMLVVETLHRIDTALAALPDKVRQAFLLAQIEGLKYRDIACRLDVSEISVKRYVKRGLVACLLTLE